MSIQATPEWKSLLPILRRVILDNRIFLTEHEQQVLMFIFQRTRMYGKAWETIPLRHFTAGVWSREAGNTCSRLRIKSNNVIVASKGLQGKGIIEVRDHPTKAYQYRIVEPGEIIGHDVINYIRQNQPKLMAAISLELRRNRRQLPPAFSSVLDIQDTLENARTARTAKPSDGIRLDRPVVSRRIADVLSDRIDPTNKRIDRLKIPTSNLALQRAKPAFSKSKRQGGKLPILPLPRRSEPNHHELGAALIEASSWQNDKRRYPGARLDFLALEKSWDDGMQTHWPDGYIKLPPSAFRNLKLAVQRQELVADDLPALISWTISRWRYLRSNVFSFNRDKPYGPDVPDIQFFIKKLPAIYPKFVRAREAARPINAAPQLPHPRAAAEPVRPNYEEREASRIRLGLPKWDDIK